MLLGARVDLPPGSRVAGFDEGVAMGKTLEQTDSAALVVRPAGDGALQIEVRGSLDEQSGQLISQITRASLRSRVRHLTVDLTSIDDFTDAGVRSTRPCYALGSHLPQGVNFVAGPGPASAALLAILSQR